MKYENNDATFQVIIGIIAVIVYNILNHLGLINILFGSATNETIIQSLTVLLMVVTTWIFARHSRKKRVQKIQPKETDNKEIIKETRKVPTMIIQEMQHSHKDVIKEVKEVKKNISISSFFTSLNNTHFHYPIIQI